MATALRSYAKVNLGLRIGPLREDRFHALATVYQTIDLWDRVTVSARPAPVTSLQIVCDDARVPCDGRNTVWKIVERALAAMGVTADVAITIEKRLPVQGGMGAGSANAAAALLGLERELAGHGVAALTQQQRLQIAAEVGSDVPLFLVGGTSLGTGRGEQVSALADGPEHPCVIAVPNVAVSTPEAFRAWDALSSVGLQGTTLTPVPQDDTLDRLGRSVSEAWAGGLSGVFSVGEGLAWDPVSALVRTGIENDFERVVFPRHPLLRDLQAALSGELPGIPSHEKAVVAMLSGSGAALFGLFASDAAASTAAARVQATGAKAMVTTTMSRKRYWREMWMGMTNWLDRQTG